MGTASTSMRRTPSQHGGKPLRGLGCHHVGQRCCQIFNQEVVPRARGFAVVIHQLRRPHHAVRVGIDGIPQKGEQAGLRG